MPVGVEVFVATLPYQGCENVATWRVLHRLGAGIPFRIMFRGLTPGARCISTEVVLGRVVVDY